MSGPQNPRVTQALEEFTAALEAMPFGQERLEKGQQFNAYECADNDEDDDPSDWEYLLCLGPITDAAFITRLDGQWRAKLIEAALRVALLTLRHREAAEAASKAREAALVEALEGAIPALEQDYEQAQEYGDADWEGLAYQRLHAARAALTKEPDA